MELDIELQPRSTWSQHKPGPLLQLFRPADQGFQKQPWIILSLCSVTIIIVSLKSLRHWLFRRTAELRFHQGDSFL